MSNYNEPLSLNGNTSKSTVGIVLQARTGSSRMPNKVLEIFHRGETLLATVISQLEKNSFGLPIVIASTNLPTDDSIAELADRIGVDCFRGSENNVLARFIDCCHNYNFTKCVRVCADNPFISPKLIDEIIEASIDSPDIDYISHSVNGTPGIRTHLGVFSELVSLKALEFIQSTTDDPYYLEHVTNYLYENKLEGHGVSFLPKDEYDKFSSMRLTIDNQKDFDSCAQIPKLLIGKKQVSLEDIFSVVSKNPSIFETMKAQINLNKK